MISMPEVWRTQFKMRERFLFLWHHRHEESDFVNELLRGQTQNVHPFDRIEHPNSQALQFVPGPSSTNIRTAGS